MMTKKTMTMRTMGPKDVVAVDYDGAEKPLRDSDKLTQLYWLASSFG